MYEKERKMTKLNFSVTCLSTPGTFEDGSHMNQISITDGGSKSQLAHVDIQEVLADGVVDTGDEITIMGRELFAGVASEAHLCRKDFCKADKFPQNYSGKIFHLDGYNN